MHTPSVPRVGPRARWLLAVAFCTSLLGCAERVSTAPGDSDPALVLGGAAHARPLLGTTWRVVAINGAAPHVAFDSVAFLRISQDARRVLSANARVACNHIFASVDTVGARVRFTGVGMTRIWCGEPANTVEQQFAQGLAESAYYGVRGDTLWLYDSGVRERARLTAR